MESAIMGKRSRHNLAAVVAGLVAAVLWASPSAVAMDLQSGVLNLLQSKDLRQPQRAVAILDLDSGAMLVSINADRAMLPASNMKLLTTAGALDLLGVDFVFRTRLGIIEPTQPGQSSSLLIHGDGDPAFGDPVLLRKMSEKTGVDINAEKLLDIWVEAIAATGQRRFAKLIVDDRVFDQQFVHPSWDHSDLVTISGAQVAGLNFHLNCLDILPSPGQLQGQAPRIDIYPPSPFLFARMSNRARTGKTGMFIIDRTLGTNDLKFSGVVRNRPSKPWRVTIHDPPMYFARLLVHRLAKRGISVDSFGRPRRDEQVPVDRPLHLLATTLPTVLQRTNRNSQNMFAEALLKRMAFKYTGTPGSWNNGAAALRSVLHKRIGPQSSAVRIADGSGLSRDNRVTAGLVVKLLASMYNDAEKAKVYRDSLAYAGRNVQGNYFAEGTIARHHKFDQLDSGQWVYAKSGRLTGVSTLSGYLRIQAHAGQSARNLAFSLLFNDLEKWKRRGQIKNLQDDILLLTINATTTPQLLAR